MLLSSRYHSSLQLSVAHWRPVLSATLSLRLSPGLRLTFYPCLTTSLTPLCCSAAGASLERNHRKPSNWRAVVAPTNRCLALVCGCGASFWTVLTVLRGRRLQRRLCITSAP